MTKQSDLEALLHRSRFQRIVTLWIVLALSIVVCWLFWQLRADGVAACERGTVAARERAEIARRVGAWELARSADRRARLDCDGAYSLWP